MIYYFFTSLLITLLVSLSSPVPDCQNKRIIFTAEPTDVVIECDAADEEAVFLCQYGGSGGEVNVEWIINSTPYTQRLPLGHYYKDKKRRILSVTNIKSWQNGTTYQCNLLSPTGSGETCVYSSTIGILIVKCQESHNAAMAVMVSPHYHISGQGTQGGLNEIATTFTNLKVDGVYIISFTELASSEICYIANVTQFSCLNDTCSHVLHIPSSPCPSDTDILVTVTVVDSDLSKSIRIGTVNSFVMIHFDNKTSSVTLTFINQPKESHKYYSVRYGPASPGCTNLTQHTKGHLFNSNSVTVALNDITWKDTLCLAIIATNGSETVSIDGVYNVGTKNQWARLYSAENVVLACATLLVVYTLLLVGIYFSYCKQHRASHNRNYDFDHESIDSSQHAHRGRIKSLKDQFKLIDLSTTSFTLLPITKERFIHELCDEIFPHIKPLNAGFVYLKVAYKDIKEEEISRRIIVMDENNEHIPKYSTVCSHISQERTKNWTLYLQERQANTMLTLGDQLLYCALSEEITTESYIKCFDVTSECKESSFLKKKLPQYTVGWIRYCYFEFIEPECIDPNQKIIVQKQDGKLVSGPGIRHLLGVVNNDSESITSPPNMAKHPEWKHIFVQSGRGERQLRPNTKYLFCARMEKMNEAIHYKVYDICEESKIEQFGSQHNPGYKANVGYGYYEFSKEEQLKARKNVIMMDKEGRLFTGPGAKFYSTGCEYGREELEGKKIAPPDLTDTSWKHIFIQSHNRDRTLHPGTRFLYCEYNTEM